jgi:excisionase family DNA binding protein
MQTLDSVRPLLSALADEIAQKTAAAVLERLPQSGPASPYLSVAEAAEYLRAKPQRVHDLLSEGKLSRFKDGSRTLLLRSELEAYVAAI